MAEAPPNTSSDSEDADAAPNVASESEEDEGYGGFFAAIRDSWQILRDDLRARQIFFITFSVLLMINVKYGPIVLETPTRSRTDIVAANPTIYNTMIVMHFLSLLYTIYLQYCISYPVQMGVRRAPGQEPESGSDSTTAVSPEWETESGQSSPYDSEHQQFSHAPSTGFPAAESVSEIVATQVGPEDQSVRPRTRSGRRMSSERLRIPLTSPLPPGRYALADIRVSPEGEMTILDIRPVEGVRTRSQSRSQVEPSKPLRRRRPRGS